MTIKYGGARKCSTKSARCQGRKPTGKKQMYWKAKRNDPCDGFYFEIGPKGGLASQQKHGLYPEQGTAEFLKQMRDEHNNQVGNTYSSSRYHKSRHLGKGPSGPMKPENTPNTYCGNIPGKEFLNDNVNHHDAEWAALMKESSDSEKKHDKKKKSKKKKKKKKKRKVGGANKVSQKKYSCENCSFKTKSQKQLKDHIKNLH